MALEKILHDSPFRSINKYLAHYHADPSGMLHSSLLVCWYHPIPSMHVASAVLQCLMVAQSVSDRGRHPAHAGRRSQELLV